MNKELQIWQFIAKNLSQKKKVSLLIVAESSGSSPGRQGFKMAVSDDNSFFGSIGGGVMEVQLVEETKNHHETKIVELVHQKNSPSPSGMICSGKQTVISFGLNISHLKTVRKIIRALKSLQPQILHISNKNFSILESGKTANFKLQRFDDSDFIYEEKLGFMHKLYIVGGGHCALALSELMSKMDFHISLFDDRPNLDTLSKNKFAHEKKVIDSYDKIDELIISDRNAYVVVMTLGYKFDEIVIRRLLDKDFKYFGVLGSKAKMKVLLSEVEKEGFNREKLAQIHTPIGLSINSQTPEEIAVSIAAEIISIKNQAK